MGQPASMMNHVGGGIREGWYWHVSDQHNTLLSIFNPEDDSATAEVSLDFKTGSVVESYKLGQRVIPAHGTDIIDIGALAASGVPDSAGHIIPQDTEGGYRVEGVASPRGRGNLMTEALVFDRKRKTFETYYNTCCNTTTSHTPLSLSGPVGGTGQMFVRERDACTGITTDVTPYAGYLSFNSGVASANPGGSANYNSAGSTTLRSSWVNTKFIRIDQSCPSGYSTSITLTSSGGNGTIWGVVAGAEKVSATASGNTLTVRSSGSSFSSSIGDVQVTAQINFQASDPFLITTRVPFRLANPQTVHSCDSGFGYQDVISYNIQDQQLTNIPVAVPWNEEWTSLLVDDNAPNDNWSLFGRPTESPGSGTILADFITGVGVNNSPAPKPLPTCTGTPVQVQHWGQRFRIGSAVTGQGQPVQTDNLTRFNEHAEHKSRVSPLP